VLEQVIELVRFIGKLPVRVNKDVPGFIGNRLQHAMWREAIYLVQRGIASAEDVDRVARLTFGLRLPAVGPLENMDLVGLDLVHSIHEYLMADLSNARRSLPLLADTVRKKRFGMKSGAGFYDWGKRNGKELIERRDRQIVRQLEYLRKVHAL
jgi:3-hydroxybutyryl-CoA dehydrogenase